MKCVILTVNGGSSVEWRKADVGFEVVGLVVILKTGS